MIEEKAVDTKILAKETVSKQIMSSRSRSLQAEISTRQAVNKAKLWHLRMGHLSIQR